MNEIVLGERDLAILEQAKHRSKVSQRTQYVNASMYLDNDSTLGLFGLAISDEFERHATIAVFQNGVRK